MMTYLYPRFQKGTSSPTISLRRSLKEENTEEDSNENQQNTPQSRVVQQDCSQCQQRFEVTLPEGHDIARTACPSCGAIETVRLS